MIKYSYRPEPEGRNFAIVEEELDEDGDVIDLNILEVVGSEKLAAHKVSELTGEPVPEHLRWEPKAPKGPPDLLGFYAPLMRQGIFKGVDLNVLAKRFWALESMRAEEPMPAARWRTWSYESASGRAWRRRFIVRLGPAATIEQAAEVLLHELVHCSITSDKHHGELFRRRLIGCAREAFGLDLDTAALLSLPAQQGCFAYAFDTKIQKAMTVAGVGARLRLDVEARFEPPPVETELEREGREALASMRRDQAAKERVAAREAKARAKLAEWEKKQAHARKVAAKWRAKVRYYDRRQEAAKRR